MKNERNFSFDSILLKAEQFCVYQERSIHEVKEKLISLGTSEENIQKILALLIKNKFIDDERFALAFVSGKHQYKSWGKIKIRFELKSKKVADSIIQMAINSIDEDEYLKQLKELAERKLLSVKAKNDWDKKAKTIRFLQSKGYEMNLILEVCEQLL